MSIRGHLTNHQLVKLVLGGLISSSKAPSTSLQTRDMWTGHFTVYFLPFPMPTVFLLPDSTSTLAGPSPRAVQPPECRVQPPPALAQLPMSTLLDPK